MQRLVTFFFILLCISDIQADDYKDGMKAYQQGNIIEALQLFIAKVTDDSDHEKSIDMINKLIPEVVNLRKQRAKEYEQKGQWDKVENEYDRLRRLDNVLQNLVAYYDKKRVDFPKIDVGDAQSEAKDLAAEKYYVQGVEAMRTIGNADKAIGFFKEARKFDPDYRDAKELSAQALYNDGMALINQRKYKEGVRVLWKTRDFYPEGFKDTEQQIQVGIDSAKVKIAVMPFEDLTLKTQFGDMGSNLSSEIIATGVSRNPIFVDFVTRDYVFSLMREQNFGASGKVDVSTAPQIGKLIGVHVFVFGKITAINPYYPKVLEENGERAAEIYSGGEKYRVYARYTKHTRTGKVEVTANYQIVDVKTGRIVDSKSISRAATSTAQWVTYVGDEQALDRSILAHNTTGDVSVLPPEILANDAVRAIAHVIAASILGYYED